MSRLRPEGRWLRSGALWRFRRGRACDRSGERGILVEPVQGEVGVRVPPAGFLKRLREWPAISYGLLLVLDEVQTGIARMGRLFAYELGFTPDIMAVGKGIGGGFRSADASRPSVRPRA